ncbi:uncharacterized protein LOC115416607 isoform X2 [Sphaeramia orbicularis]|uniref:uncharacterized protein LOC115416607 isoform X2 n=1 Tax=Sphaeramia orbicularis TaxID=375764 RepID=UPI00117C501D|nr:uncharacterized protein LOC115416607 isoform X2 [Sphaeramia orbicularis]
MFQLDGADGWRQGVWTAPLYCCTPAERYHTTGSSNHRPDLVDHLFRPPVPTAAQNRDNQPSHLHDSWTEQTGGDRGFGLHRSTVVLLLSVTTPPAPPTTVQIWSTTCSDRLFQPLHRTGTISRHIYMTVLPDPQLTFLTSPSGLVEVNCTARSRPAADIVWDVDGDNRTLGPPVSWSYEQGDGTTVVTSTVSFQSGQFSDGSVRCTVHHQGLDKPLSVSLNTND